MEVTENMDPAASAAVGSSAHHLVPDNQDAPSDSVTDRLFDRRRRSTSSSASDSPNNWADAADQGTSDPPPPTKRRKTEAPDLLKLLAQHVRSQGGKRDRAVKTSNMDVNPRVVEILRKIHMETATDILSVTPIDLRNASLTGQEVDEVFRQTAMIWWGGDLNVFRVSPTRPLQPGPRLSLGCPILDRLFRGGILPDQLVEIAGAAGTGKSQFCLVLALMAQRPVSTGGLGGETLYICTEMFSGRRLKQMADAIQVTEPPDSAPSMDRIYIENLTTQEDVQSFLSGRIHQLLNQRSIKLIVLDSIASIFRYQERAQTSIQDRTGRLQRLAVTLRRIQTDYGVAVVCSNQATTVPNDHLQTSNRTDRTVPALGIAWSNFVTTSVFLQKMHRTDPWTGLSVLSRNMKIVFSPHLPRSEVRFEVVPNGLRGVGLTSIMNS